MSAVKLHNTNMKQVRYALVILTMTLFCSQLSAQSGVHKLPKSPQAERITIENGEIEGLS